MLKRRPSALTVARKRALPPMNRQAMHRWSWRSRLSLPSWRSPARAAALLHRLDRWRKAMSEEGVIDDPVAGFGRGRSRRLHAALERREDGRNGLGLGEVAECPSTIRPECRREIEVELAVDDLPVGGSPSNFLPSAAKARSRHRSYLAGSLERVEMRLAHEAVGAAGMRRAICPSRSRPFRREESDHVVACGEPGAGEGCAFRHVELIGGVCREGSDGA